MGNHPFNVAVVLFWLATMSWLFVAKVLPPLRVGEPPSYQSILSESVQQQPVCWSVRIDGKPIGWAANKVVQRADRVTELYSRVYLWSLPLDELAPGWLASVLKPVLYDLGPIHIDKKSKVTVDPLGRLVGFDSRVQIAEIRDAIRVHGYVEGSTLKLKVQSGEVSHKVECFLPPNALMTDELSPQALMPGLRVGQTWTVPLYSPFRPATSPIEILQAQVEREQPITWGGRRTPTKLIVFRGDPGSGLSGDATRGRMWVRADGVVIRQEVTILQSQLHFLRLPSQTAQLVVTSLGDDWNAELSDATAAMLLDVTSARAP